MSSRTRIWPSQAGEAPMPMVGIGERRRDLAGERLDDGLQHDGEGAGLGDRLGVGLDRLGAARRRVPCTLKPPMRVEALRRQADMAHDRDAALDEEADGLGHAAPPSIFTAPQPVSFITRAALRKAAAGLSS